MTENYDYGELLRRIRQGDSSAEQQLVSTFWRGVVAILFSQTRDKELSRDLAQDTLMLVLTKARNGDIREPAALKTYIRKVGENKLIGFRRKQMRQKTDTSSEFLESFAASQASLLSKVKDRELKEFVGQVLDELENERDRDILRRHYLIGEEKETICSALRLTRSQADTVLHRARKRLKVLLTKRESARDGVRPTDFLVLLLCVVGSGASAASIYNEPQVRVSDKVAQSHLSILGAGRTAMSWWCIRTLGASG